MIRPAVGLVLACSLFACESETPPPPAPATSATGIASQTQAEGVLASVQNLRRDGRIDEAESVLRSSLETYPRDRDLRLALATLLLEAAGVGPTSDMERVAEAYRQYRLVIGAGATDGTTLLTAGVLAERLGQPAEEAIAHFEAAQQADPGSSAAPLRLGRALLAINRLDEARAALARSVAINDAQPVAWGMLAEIALRDGRPSVARQHASKARELEPTQGAYRLLEARALRRSGDIEGAILVLNDADETSRITLPFVKLKAECFGELGRPSDAMAVYRDAFDRSPSLNSDGQALFEAAVWAQRADDVGAAVQFAERATSLGHESAGRLLQSLTEPTP